MRIVIGVGASGILALTYYQTIIKCRRLYYEMIMELVGLARSR